MVFSVTDKPARKSSNTISERNRELVPVECLTGGNSGYKCSACAWRTLVILTADDDANAIARKRFDAHDCKNYEATIS